MKMMTRTLAVCASCVLLASANVEATVLIPASLDELTREAGAIVRGRVVAVDARLTPDRREIETLVTVQTEMTLKGSLGATAQFVVPGGALGRYRSIFVGAPSFGIGQHVIVFLGWHGPSYPYLIGLGQGVFRIGAGADDVLRVVPPIVSAPASGGVAVVRGDPARRPMALAEFEQRIRAMVGGDR